ncbi:hypothetical protein, unlikely [Trypanosoma brucei gambiense DAL972]|uniref:T. brucei spp.-specific protein n=1 Tax=Trypanosoma brucei gambiense (strain MHOM/CI/86/DAL972) TaxID=679716 RepID=C9ZUN0_TRYB9|nr:hypothetical protein, unlikely [Trypanosoma brucei gambiense DAL972]CBH13118.1 hypothetical protein, unlikely [Trypanosoma brucei gambiense DAL972]|eukprot:XP_011775395.1 hypothetical protein, unlikely [Trypanosoma brucei gambiense DAL972]
MPVVCVCLTAVFPFFFLSVFHTIATATLMCVCVCPSVCTPSTHSYNAQMTSPLSLYVIPAGIYLKATHGTPLSPRPFPFVFLGVSHFVANRCAFCSQTNKCGRRCLANLKQQ